MAPTIGYLLDTNVLVALIRGKELGTRIDAQYNLRAELITLPLYHDPLPTCSITSPLRGDWSYMSHTSYRSYWHPRSIAFRGEW